VKKFDQKWLKKKGTEKFNQKWLNYTQKGKNNI